MLECSKSFAINRSLKNGGTAERKKDSNHKCLPWDLFGIHWWRNGKCDNSGHGDLEPLCQTQSIRKERAEEAFC
jgi:hypothetical protein